MSAILGHWATWSTGFLILAGLAIYGIKRYGRTKKLEGAREVTQKEVEDILDDTMRAKRLEEAARASGGVGADPERDKRLRRKYQRNG